jgi:hypothetical protein
LDFGCVIQENVEESAESSNLPEGPEKMNRHRSLQKYGLSFPPADHDCGAMSFIGLNSVSSIVLLGISSTTLILIKRPRCPDFFVVQYVVFFWFPINQK